MDNSSLPEALIEKQILATTNLNSMTMRSTNEFICVRGYRLHARTFWPKSSNVKGVVSFIHGYASHVSRPIHEHLAKMITEMGFTYLTHDMYGHGFSNGIRGYVPDPKVLIESAVTMIYTVFDSETFDNGRAFIQKPYGIAKNLPVFLIGHSMGGAVTIPAAKELQSLGYNLAGCIFLAPMITLAKPPAWQKFLLVNVLAWFFPETMNAKGSRSASVVSDEYQRYCAFDGNPNNIHGIGYSQPIRYGTYASLLQLIDMNEKLIPTVDFPFIIFHDTADVVVPYDGSQFLFDKSRTGPAEKEFVTMDGGHDLLARRLGAILLKMEEWLLDTLQDG